MSRQWGPLMLSVQAWGEEEDGPSRPADPRHTVPLLVPFTLVGIILHPLPESRCPRVAFPAVTQHRRWVLGGHWGQWDTAVRGSRGGQGGNSPIIPPRPSLSCSTGGSGVGRGLRGGGDSLSYQWSCLDGNKICTERHENGVNKRDKNGTIKPATSPPLIKKRERGEERDALSP